MFEHRRGSIISLLCILLFVLVLYQYVDATKWKEWSIVPLDISHWKGIWLGAFVHGSWDHLMGNVGALVFFGILFLIQFPKHWLKFWFLQHIIASILLWLIGNMGLGDLGFWRDPFGHSVVHTSHAVAHIGSSIWVYSFGGFLMATAVVHRTKQSIAILFLVLLVYGGFFWGILPVDPKVSWQGHLSGLITGVLLALTIGLKWLPKENMWRELGDEDEGNTHHDEPNNKDHGHHNDDPYAHF
jgi:membrane associated rhomboid family serine protease